MTQHGPMALTVTAAGARPPHQQHPRPGGLRAECTRALVPGSRSSPSKPLSGHPPRYSMRTQTAPCEAVPAIGSPRNRAPSEQKKRSLTAAAAKLLVGSLFNGNEDPRTQ